MELLQMSVRAMSEKIKSKALGVTETVSALQKKIAEKEPGLGAFLTINDAHLKMRMDLFGDCLRHLW